MFVGNSNLCTPDIRKVNVERLNERHKQTLRFLVKASRDGLIQDEFMILWRQDGGVIRDGKQNIQVPGATMLAFDLLEEEGLIFSKPHTSTSLHSHGIGRKYGQTTNQNTRENYRTCYITPDGFRAVDNDFTPIQDVTVNRPPVEITESLARFRTDFPDSTRIAFIMMQFGETTAHKKIVSGIRAALEPHGLTALRADDKQYHDDLYFNIMTYIYGSRFGISVFDRIESDSFNPNVSLEVGYMMGLSKSVCFLKDKSLNTLQTDLVGKLYRKFDPQDPLTSIPPVLIAWMGEKGFIVQH